MKVDRQAVWNKSNGSCWYCGCTLPEKGWHADHVKPLCRSGYYSFRKDKLVTTRIVERDTIDNIVPACRACNLFKRDFTLEQFRHEVSKQVERAREKSVNFRTAERFGQIVVKESPIVFWFEQAGRDYQESHTERQSSPVA